MTHEMSYTYVVIYVMANRSSSLDYGAAEEARNVSVVPVAQPPSRTSSAMVVASHSLGRGRPGAVVDSNAVLEENLETTWFIPY